jgi:hypothetical protein
VLTSLFTSSIDCNSSIPSDLDLQVYFSDPAHPGNLGPAASPSTQPVLGAPYKFFVLLANLVQLSRTSLIPGASYVQERAQLRDEYIQTQWNRNNAQNDPGYSIETLYAVSIEILLLLTDHQPNEKFLISFETLLKRGLIIIVNMQIDTWFSYYYLWPLLLIGSVAVDQADRKIITEKVARASEARQTGPVLLAKRRLKLVWKEGDRYEQFGNRVMITAQFRALLEENTS